MHNSAGKCNHYFINIPLIAFFSGMRILNVPAVERFVIQEHRQGLFRAVNPLDQGKFDIRGPAGPGDENRGPGPPHFFDAVDGPGQAADQPVHRDQGQVYRRQERRAQSPGFMTGDYQGTRYRPGPGRPRSPRSRFRPPVPERDPLLSNRFSSNILPRPGMNSRADGATAVSLPWYSPRISLMISSARDWSPARPALTAHGLPAMNEPVFQLFQGKILPGKKVCFPPWRRAIQTGPGPGTGRFFSG